MSTDGGWRLRKFATGLRQIHEAMKAATHCLLKLTEEAEAEMMEYRVCEQSKVYSQQLDLLRDRVFSAMGVPREMLGLPDERSGLKAWFDELNKAVQELQPDNDLLTFKRQVEDFLNDHRVKTLREGSSEGNKGPSQENHVR